MYLSNFRSDRPPHGVPQAESLNWLARAHARLADAPVTVEHALRRLSRFGCGDDVIHRRYSYLDDFVRGDPAAMSLYGGEADLDQRHAHFARLVEPAVERVTVDDDFDHWLHVTCTGYLSPSVCQRVASRRGWGESKQIMHGYHMGCYAAIPALRMARGLGKVEIVHTELCTLHLEPERAEPEQLVVQSLFADGVIAYRATEARPPGPSLAVEATRELIAADSLDAMTWVPTARSFRMTLSRRVPELVRGVVARVTTPWREPGTVFAIHPGGPRIIDAVKDALGLDEDQVRWSREILRDRGNMSSATLPHVWARMVNEVRPGTPVISLAFGPGLTIAAARMRVSE